MLLFRQRFSYGDITGLIGAFAFHCQVVVLIEKRVGVRKKKREKKKRLILKRKDD